MVEVSVRGRKVRVPQCPAELSPEQYAVYCGLAVRLLAGVMTLREFRVRWFSALLDLRCDYTLLRPEFADEIGSQESAVDGFFIDAGKEGGARLLSFDAGGANLLPEFAGWRGPGDWLDGLSYGRFVECLTVLETVMTGEAEGEDADGRCRHVARLLYGIPPEKEVPAVISLHAPCLFMSVWGALMKEPVEINGRKIDFRILFRGSGSGKADDRTGWTGITFEVAASGVFGTVAEVEQTDFWSVLLYLYRCRFEQDHEKKF